MALGDELCPVPHTRARFHSDLTNLPQAEFSLAGDLQNRQRADSAQPRSVMQEPVDAYR